MDTIRCSAGKARVCRPARRNALRLRARCFGSRRFCCSTNRTRISIPRVRRSCSRRSARRRRAAPRRPSSRIGSRCSRFPTRSWCCATAALKPSRIAICLSRGSIPRRPERFPPDCKEGSQPMNRVSLRKDLDALRPALAGPHAGIDDPPGSSGRARSSPPSSSSCFSAGPRSRRWTPRRSRRVSCKSPGNASRSSIGMAASSPPSMSAKARKSTPARC